MRGFIVAFLFVLIPSTALTLSDSARSRKGKGLRGGFTSAVRPFPTSALMNRGAPQKSLDKRETGRVILILQTRNNQVVVSSGTEHPLYSINTEEGIPLANQINESELEARFPELYDVVRGIAWAGL